MKLRTILIFSNLLSISIIIIFLLISYVHMFLSTDVILLLSLITIGAGLVSIVSHLIVTHPLLKGVRELSETSKKLAEGEFNTHIEESGPKEFKELAASYNRMADDLNQMFQKVKESEAFKQDLIANMSHDLKTPIASINSYVEALQDDVIEDKETRSAYLATIHTETKRVSQLIQELLELSQLERNEGALKTEFIHLDQVVIETLQEFDILLRDKSLQLDVKLDDGLKPVQAMPNQLKRVLSNLVENSIRYTQDGDKITLHISQDMFETRFTLEDTGPGIEEADQQHIFERFYRVEKSRNKSYGGSGLGLAICKEIVERHGGEIGVKSQLNEGTVFWFTLPFNMKEETTK
ncbi:HAMP domain-containing protein [Pontibacillus sp. ALD_SL1]|uniref:sensor histidine kinase n=1 Tax=Pontibacillus sp. ALD_SL1 TaxID=2777185 RepID=UPI001A95F569|nr:HAMP domain-containing sensor histidine kinase [Pontibacillus sp. ALD_SL1]QST00653.1 HAMP domain-containing protein [Pontibacillus sp. ALD_SL1]